MMNNVMTTYFLNGTEIVGKLDTCELTNGGFETMEFYFEGTDSGAIVEEHTSDIVDAMDVHNSWATILAKRYDAKPYNTSFMGLPVVDCQYLKLAKAFDAYKHALSRYEIEQLEVKYSNGTFSFA